MTQQSEPWRAIRTADVEVWPKRIREALLPVAPTLGALADMTDRELLQHPKCSERVLRAAIEAVRRAMAGEQVVAAPERSLADLARLPTPVTAP